MAKLFRLTDRITVKIANDFTLQLSPLSFDKKIEIQTLVSEGMKGDQFKILEGTRKAIKYCVKGVSGIEDTDGNEYVLEFDDDGTLSDDDVENLLNLSYSNHIAQVCSIMSSGVPAGDFVGVDGNPIEGVKRVMPARKKGKSSKN